MIVGVKEKSETQKTKKGPTLFSTNDSALGWRGQKERMTDKCSTSSWKANLTKSWEEIGGSDSAIKEKRLRSDLDTKITPTLPPTCEVRRGDKESEVSQGLLPNSSQVWSPHKEAQHETQGLCCTTWVLVRLSAAEIILFMVCPNSSTLHHIR